MRRKRHKAARRTVRFFRINFGFREPYKVLLDGNFVHALRQINSAPVDAVVAKLLGARARLLTTPCVLAELKSLGAEFGATRGAMRTAAGVHKCGHDAARLPAADCLQACIGTRNPDHFIVATQDRRLRAALAAVPAGAAAFATPAGAHLEPPTPAQAAAVREAGAAALNVPAAELQSRALAGVTGDGGSRGSGGGPAFRRRKAKGPNPLAVKKKAAKGGGVGGGSGGGGDGGGGVGSAGRARTRKSRAARVGCGEAA